MKPYPIKRHAGDVLVDAAKTFAKRRAVYGDNWKRAGAALQALFPNGITLATSDDHDRFHILSLIIVKLSRYTVSWDRGEMHQDSIHDAAVYCAMLEAIDEGIRDAQASSNRHLPKLRGHRKSKNKSTK